MLQFSTVFKNLTTYICFFSESFTGCDGSGDSGETYDCCKNNPQGCGLLEGDCDRCHPCPFNQISSQFYHDFVKMLLAKVSFLTYWMKFELRIFFLDKPHFFRIRHNPTCIQILF